MPIAVIAMSILLMLNSRAHAGVPSPQAFLGGVCANMGGCYCQDGHGVPWNASCEWGRENAESNSNYARHSGYTAHLVNCKGIYTCPLTENAKCRHRHRNDGLPDVVVANWTDPEARIVLVTTSDQRVLWCSH
jgi:hypothetical protein